MADPGTTRAAGRSWWREPWPWLLIGLTACAVAASVYTVVIAGRHADTQLAASPDSPLGQSADADLERGLRARALQLQGRLSDAGGSIVVELDHPVDAATLTLVLRHPYAPSHDLRLQLQRAAPGHYVGRAAVEAVRYAAAVETAQWRLAGTWKPGSAVVLGPGV
jgi:hypothetical protein